MLMIWHLCEVIYFPRDLGVPVAEEFLDWVNLHDPGE